MTTSSSSLATGYNNVWKEFYSVTTSASSLPTGYNKVCKEFYCVSTSASFPPQDITVCARGFTV